MPREWVGENNTCLVSIEMELNNEMDVAKKTCFRSRGIEIILTKVTIIN